MQGGHAVDGVPVVDVDVGHVDQAPLVQDGHGGVAADLLGPAVQLPDDGLQLGRHPLNEVEGPLLQGLRQDGVVGVGAGTAHLVDGLVHAQALPGEETDQLRDHHGGVGIVDLDGHVVRQLSGAIAPLLQLLEDQLRTGGDHEILLIDPQQPPCVVAVIGI